MAIVIKTKNYGIFPETFNIIVSVNSTIIDTLSDVSLESEDSTTLALDWNTTNYPKGNYTISVYIAPLEDEVGTSDNILKIGMVKVTIPGDVNGDFFVNDSDVGQIRLFWQQISPSAPADVDINGDGIVNIKDATQIGINWLQHA